MVSARRKYDQCALAEGPRSTTRLAPISGSLFRVRKWLAMIEPPCGFSPEASASISTTVDFPDPFSPTSTVSPAGTSRPSRRICATAGAFPGRVDSSTGVAGSLRTLRTGRSSILFLSGAPGSRR